jgi:hypothetical protein
MSIGTDPKNIDAKDIVLFLEQFWWENRGSKALGLRKTLDTPAELSVTMLVLFMRAGDMPDEVYRHIRSVRVNRRTGELVRQIEPDIFAEVGKTGLHTL